MTLRAAVMGGSLGGLTAALCLRDAGCAVTVYERSPTALLGVGAGIVLNPMTVRYLIERGGFALEQIGVPARQLRYLDARGAVAHEQPCAYRLSSYNALYQGLLGCFGQNDYQLGQMVQSFAQDETGVTVELASGGRERYDLLVCADGIRSQARRVLAAEANLRYAGYIAWRGTVARHTLDAELDALTHEAVVYHLRHPGHFLIYPIPLVDSTGTRQPFLNWLWYYNLPGGPALDALMTDRDGVRREVALSSGAMRPEALAVLRNDAQAQLPPVLARLVELTGEPFIQAIVEGEVPRMVQGRVCLIGDAACVARPHVAAGTAKAAADGWALGEAFGATQDDVATTLRRWEGPQLALGRSVVERARIAGDRVQFKDSWRIGEPLPVGLYQAGDSRLD